MTFTLGGESSLVSVPSNMLHLIKDVIPWEFLQFETIETRKKYLSGCRTRHPPRLVSRLLRLSCHLSGRLTDGFLSVTCRVSLPKQRITPNLKT